jgi:hypothetical protein
VKTDRKHVLRARWRMHNPITDGKPSEGSKAKVLGGLEHAAQRVDGLQDGASE